MGKLDMKKDGDRKKDFKNSYTPHKLLIGTLAARSARPATSAAAATAKAAAVASTLGDQVWLDHPLLCIKYI